MLRSDISGNISHETEQALTQGGEGTWQVTEGFGLFTAEFSRDGSDLLVQDTSGDVLRLPGYFLGGTPAEIVSEDGANLPGRVVERLAGPLFPGQYAQSGGASLADAIGQVETTEGGAFAQRTDGTTVRLEVGTKVFQGDVVRTEEGGSLGLTFTDGTIFTLASGSRMVLDELIYDPESTENSGVFDLVEGGFVFIAGQAAGTGGIEINTPAATMGIRGTTVKVDIQTANGVSTVTVSLNPDPDGGTGEIELFDLSGNLISTITSTDTKWIIRPPFTNEPPVEVERFQSDLNDDASLLSQAVAAFQSALTRVANGETFVELPEGDSDAPDNENEAVEDDAEDDGESGDPVVPPPLDDTGDGSDGAESGSGNQDLDGTDEELPESDEGPAIEEDALLDDGSGPTEVASNGNGAPEVDTTPIQSVEDTPITGQLPISDRDGDPFEVTLVRGAENGVVVLATDGVFTYTPDENFDGTDTFVVTAQDSEGGVTESEITVVVDPVNDAPVVDFATDEGSAFETGLNSETDNGQAVGQVTYADVDEADTPATWTIAASDENTTGLGAISIDAQTGDWTYDLDQDSADALAQDENVVETFLATVTDNEGATDTTVVVVTVTGSNDGPVITSDAVTASLNEGMTGFNTLDEGSDGEEPNPLAIQASDGDDETAGSVTGTLSFFDVDQGDTQGQWSVAANAENTTELGSVTIDALTGVWVYTLDERAADVLGNDDSETEVFTATVTDAFGATAAQQISITVTGFNDAPTIEFSIEDVEATVFEEGFDGSEDENDIPAFRIAALDEALANATGTLRYTDPDGQPGDNAFWAVTPDGASLGSMTIDAVTGQWHYFLDETAAQSLREGQEVVETFTATVTDNLGAASEQVITITIVGANDASEIVASAQDLSGSAADGGISTATGKLTFIDPDAAPGEVATWSVAAVGSTRGSMNIDPVTGRWLYTLDQTLADTLAQGVQVEEFFTATLTDALGATSDQTITITLTGENDVPVITQSQTSGTVKEAGAADAGTPTVSGDMIAVDPDMDGAILIWTIEPNAANVTALGAMVIDPVSGTWTYTLDQDAAQSMTTGDSVVERFTAKVSDPFGESDTCVIEVKIDGTNDAPVLVAGTGNAFEDTASIKIELNALASDPDTGEDGSTLLYALVGNPAEGTAQIVGTELIFSPDVDFIDLAAGDTRDVEVNFSATDAGGSSVLGTVTITVTGTNSAPTFTAATAFVNEDAPSLIFDLIPFGDDSDTGEDGSTLTYSLVGTPALGSASIVGTNLTFVPGADFTDLAEGETTEVILNLNVSDSAGANTTGTVTVFVTGTNGAPNLAVGSLLLSEDAGVATLDLATLGSDPDIDEDGSTLIYTIVGAPSVGLAGISGTILTFDTNGAFEGLAAGDSSSVTIGIKATDAEGESATSTVEVTITGSNDAPIITLATSKISGDVKEQGDTSSGILSVSGDLNYFDADESTLGEATWEITPQNTTFGSMAINGLTGGWIYTLDNAAADQLNEGEIRTEAFTATVTDAAGGIATQTVTITITGTNDAPSMTTQSRELSEDAPSISVNLIAFASDPDAADAPEDLIFDIVGAPENGAASIVNGSLNFFTNGAFEDLAVGETRTAFVDVRVRDGNGGSEITTFQFNVTGANDGPTIVLENSDITGTVTEAGQGINFPEINDGMPDASGVLAYFDGDEREGALGKWSIDAIEPTYGTMEIDPDTGAWSYFLNESAADFLREGATVDDRYTAIVTDSEGETALQVVTITITGTNDSPIVSASESITGGVYTGGEPETLTGQLVANDPDDFIDAPTWDIFVPGEASGDVYGTMTIDSTTGQWTYITNTVAIATLAEGDFAIENYIAVVTDEFGQSDTINVNIRINGTNEAPVIIADISTNSGLVQEPGAISAGLLIAGNTLSYVDPDEGTTSGIWSISAENPTQFGTAVINPASGAWTYTLDPTTVDDLDAGDFENDTFDVIYTDAFGAASEPQEITIQIAGSNDAPILTPQVIFANQNSVETISLRPNASDVDEDDTAASLEFSVSSPPSQGIAGITEGDSFNFDPNGEFDYLAAGESVDMSVDVTVSDTSGASSASSVLINVAGVNDAPEVAANGVTATTIDFDSGTKVVTTPTGAQTAGTYSQDGFTATWTMDRYSVDFFEGVPATTPGDAVVPIQNLDGDLDLEFGVFDSPVEADQEYRDGYFNLSADDGSKISIAGFDIVNDDGEEDETGNVTLYGFNGDLQIEAINADDGEDTWSLDIFNTATSTSVLSDTDASYQDVLDALVNLDSLNVQTRALDFGLGGLESTGLGTGIGIDNIILGKGPVAPLANVSLTEFAGLTGSIVEHNASGIIEFIDVDLSDVGHTTTIESVTTSGAASGLPSNTILMGFLSLSTAKLNGVGDGEVSWTFAAQDLNFDYLEAGETVEISYQLEIDDQHGGVGQTTLKVIVTGTNDAPVISGDVSGSITENTTTINVNGDLNHTDVDAGNPNDLWVAASTTAIEYGQYSIETNGTWRFTLLNNNPATDALDAGDVETTEFTAVTSDGTEQVVTITVTGANDDALISGTTAAGIVEDSATNSITHNLDHTDVDGDDTDDVWQIVGTGTASTNGYGTYEIDVDGNWTYTLNNANATVNALGQGDPVLEDRFTVFTEDGTDQVVVVEIAGANDAPVIDAESSTLSGDLAFLTDAALPNTNVSTTPTYVRQPTIFGGGYAHENVAGVAFDPVTGKVYESTGYTRRGESAVRVFNNAADFEAGTISTTINLGSGTDVYGTYFTAYNDVLIGKSGGAPSEGPTQIAFWNAGNGAVLEEIIPIPGVLTIGATNYGFQWGGFTSINLIQDTSGIYALGKTTGSSWTLAEIDPATQTVIGTETFNAGIQGFAFSVEGLVFFGNYNTGNINRVYNIETNVLSGVNITIGALGGTNDYWSNISYDTTTDTLYMVNSPNSAPNGLIYKIENISELVLAPSTLPQGTILFDDVDATDTHSVSVDLPDAGPYLGSLVVEDPVFVSGTSSEVSWAYDITQSNYDSLSAGQTITENFDVTVSDGIEDDTETVTITVTGINDAAVVTGTDTGAIVEDSPTFVASGDLNHTDVDGNHTDDVWQVVSAGAASTNGYGNYEIDVDGNWTYTLNNANTTVNALGQGDPVLEDTFTVLTEDGTAKSVTIEITGANDAPIVFSEAAAFTLGIADDPGTGWALFEGHYYQFVNTPSSWADARTAALADGAYLANITSATEQTFVNALAAGNFAWIGGTDTDSEGVWVWKDGPEAGVQFWQGAADGFRVGGVYENWGGTNPDDDGNEDFLSIVTDGTWNDSGVVGGVGYISEYSTLKVFTGTVASNDSDPEMDPLTYTLAAPFAGLTMATNGTWTFDQTTTTFFDSIGATETSDYNVTYNVSDGLTSTPGTIRFDITGTNDAAVISGGLAAGTVLENAVVPTATGNLNHTDIDGDNADDVWQVVAPAANAASDSGFGTYVVTATGQWTYTLDAANPAVAALGVSESLTDRFTILTEDGTPQQVVITITGENDAPTLLPVINVQTNSEDDAFTGIAAPIYFQLNNRADDEDPDDDASTLTYSYSDFSSSGFETVPTGLKINIAGNFDFLNDGDTAQATATVVATDSHGAMSNESTLIWTITGVNDAAVISGDISGGVVVEGAATNFVEGTVTHQDVDNDDDKFIAQGTTASGLGYGTFTMTIDGDWTYTVDNNNVTVNALDTGVLLADLFTVAAEDGTQQIISVSISGTNDAPTTSAVTASATLGTVADPGVGWTEFQGHYYQFVDLPTGISWSDARAAANALGGYLPNVTSQAENDFLLALSSNKVGWLGGSDAATEGSWIWVDGPEAGQQFWQGTTTGNSVGGLYSNWNSIQPDGGVENALHTFGDGTWNDIIDGPTATMDYFVEIGDLGAITGTLLGDVSDPEGHSVTFTQLGSVSGLTINTDGTWSLNQNLPEYIALGGGVMTTLNATYRASDGMLTADNTLAITLTGANDAALTSGVSTGSVVEDSATNTATGDLNHTDVDTNNDDDIWVEIAGISGTYGDFEMTTLGVWTYTLDNNNATVDALNVGGSLTELFTVQTEDLTETTVKVTIQGSDDIGILSGDTSGTVVEDAAMSAISGTLTYTDVDNGPVPFNTSGSGIGPLGGYSYSGGNWSYTVYNTSPAVNALNDGETLSDSFTIFHPSGPSQTITVTIEGNTDAPPLTANDDSGFIETIDVLIVGTSVAKSNETKAQLDGAVGTHRFDFDVSITDFDPTRTSTQWDDLLSLADVVLLGGRENVDTLEGNIAYNRISNYYLTGGNVVTTGGVVEQFYDIPAGTATDGFLDTITPIGSQTGGTSTGGGITFVPALASHPIADDVPNNSVTPGLVTLPSPWYSVGSGQTDANSLALANLGFGAGSDHAISIQTAPAVGAGEAVFIGGAYLDHTVSEPSNTELRTGNADYILEQAIAWAAGIDKVNENTIQKFTKERLLDNDVGVTASSTLTGASLYSAEGATIRLISGELFYDPSTSQSIDALNEGQTIADNFNYVVTENGVSDSATINLVISGTTEVTNAPVISDPELNGFGAGDSSQYRYGATHFQDDDEAGIQYAIYRNGNIGGPPLGVTFDASTATFTFTAAAHTNYLQDMSLYAYEADGQNTSVDVGFSVDSNGDLRFVFTNYAQADGGPVLEVAFDDAVAAGADSTGSGELVDLSGLDALGAPMTDVDVIDIRNGQENEILINSGEWLSLIDGLAGDGYREVTIEADSYDNIFALPSGPGWTATLNDDTTGGNDSIDFRSNGTDSDYGSNGYLFLTLTIDGAEGNIVPS